ncbi:MAG TPA: hypothetical protein VL049_07945 [Candidatus Dormibacteraeota bacterium]|nr:hypothetical protein [Candidatus Dormibacteraeota bacterium]
MNASYRFCVFAGAANTTAATANVPPDASRWQPTAKGFSYKDPAAAAAGIVRVKLIASDTDRARIGLKGKGASLDIAAPPVDLPITA